MTSRIPDRPLPLAPARLHLTRPSPSTEVRPDVVARGKRLAADPNYPNFDILREVAGSILASDACASGSRR